MPHPLPKLPPPIRGHRHDIAKPLPMAMHLSENLSRGHSGPVPVI
jgi:hypothetical protein